VGEGPGVDTLGQARRALGDEVQDGPLGDLVAVPGGAGADAAGDLDGDERLGVTGLPAEPGEAVVEE
jgi:hypothetical protein